MGYQRQVDHSSYSSRLSRVSRHSMYGREGEGEQETRRVLHGLVTFRRLKRGLRGCIPLKLQVAARASLLVICWWLQGMSWGGGQTQQAQQPVQQQQVQQQLQHSRF